MTVHHEGGLVYLDGRGLAYEEAEELCRKLDSAAREARRWQCNQDRRLEQAATIARLEASGLTLVELRDFGYYSRWLGRRNGLPVYLADGQEWAARFVYEVGDGPRLEARVYSGRKWRPMADLHDHRHVSAWRVAS